MSLPGGNGNLAWPDEFGDAPVSCCLVSTPCVFHQQFPNAIRSPQRSQNNDPVAAAPTAPPVIITPPTVPPPAPADSSASDPATQASSAPATS